MLSANIEKWEIGESIETVRNSYTHICHQRKIPQIRIIYDNIRKMEKEQGKCIIRSQITALLYVRLNWMQRIYLDMQNISTFLHLDKDAAFNLAIRTKVL